MLSSDPIYRRMADQKPLSLAEYYSTVMRFALPPHLMPVCDALDDDRIRLLMTISGPGNGKSTVSSQAYPAKVLGEDSSMTILGISAAENLMQGFMSAVAQTIEHNPKYKQLFPRARPDKALGWSSERGLFVVGRPPGDPDASFFGCGLSSKALTGKHAKVILLDDIHDQENSATPEACAKVTETFYRTILGRGDPQSARYILSGRRFQEGDAYGSLMRTGEWVVMVLPAERAGSHDLWWDVCVPPGLECIFSEMRPWEGERPDWIDWKCDYYRVAYGSDPTGEGFFWPDMPSKRKEWLLNKRNMPAIAEAVYQCNPRNLSSLPFQDDDFCFYDELPWEELRLGRSSPSVEEFIRALGGRVVQSWDTAFGKSPDSAYSVCVTAVLFQSRNWWRGEDEETHGKCERHFRVYILDVYRDKVASNRLIHEVRRQYRKWRPRRVLIEKKASGISLLQSLTASDIPVKAVEVREGKLERALDAVGGGAGSVQGWFRQHRVPLPEGAPWVKDFIKEFKGFVGTRAVGPKDQFDACVHLVAHAIEAGVKEARLPGLEARRGDVVSFSETMDPRMRAISSISMLDQIRSVDPFETTCGRCAKWTVDNGGRPWCALHKMARIALDTCPDWRAVDEPETEEPL